MNTKALENNYCCTTDSILTGCITVLFGDLTAQDHRQQEKGLSENYHNSMIFTPSAAKTKP